MRKRAELLSHIQNTNSQYNLPEIGKKIAYKANRAGVAERFGDEAVQKSIALDLALIDHYDRLLSDVELYIVSTAKQHDVNAFYRLRSVPGIGKILALVILYEVQAIQRFPRVQDFVSYAGEMCQGVRRQEVRHFGKKDRQCLSQVGILGGGGTISSGQYRWPKISGQT